METLLAPPNELHILKLINKIMSKCENWRKQTYSRFRIGRTALFSFSRLFLSKNMFTKQITSSLNKPNRGRKIKSRPQILFYLHFYGSLHFKKIVMEGFPQHMYCKSSVTRHSKGHPKQIQHLLIQNLIQIYNSFHTQYSAQYLPLRVCPFYHLQQKGLHIYIK